MEGEAWEFVDGDRRVVERGSYYCVPSVFELFLFDSNPLAREGYAPLTLIW